MHAHGPLGFLEEFMAKSLSGSVCPLCTFEAPDLSIVLSHLRTVHSSDSCFIVTCGLHGCTTTSRSFSALYSHIYRRHRDVIKKRKERLCYTPTDEVTENSTNVPLCSESVTPTGKELMSVCECVTVRACVRVCVYVLCCVCVCVSRFFYSMH